MSLAAEDRGAVSGAAGAARTMTYEEFLREEREDDFVEWVGGRVVPMAPISDEHMDVAGFIQAVLRAWAQDRGLGVVRADPFQMKTGPDLPGRAPDVVFLAKENLGRLKKVYIDGPGDLVVEVISPESRGRDRGDKFFEYERGGVREYWLIDPERRQAEFYQRGADGIYRVVGAEEGVYRSAVLPGLWVRVEWMWKRPTVIEVLKAWGLV